MKKFLHIAVSALVILAAVAVYFYLRRPAGSARTVQTISWIRNPASHPEWKVKALVRCEDAPFLMPSEGLIGFLWGDSFRPGHHHQGIDIFGGTETGVTPVYAAADGYLSRLPDWKSSLIIRVPRDPLKPDRQIWLYYTHLADDAGRSFILNDFPPGTTELFVEAGSLLGYQGNYSGTAYKPVGVHLHFSIVMDDGNGRFLNELEMQNTLDPSPYLGMALNAETNSGQVPVCP